MKISIVDDAVLADYRVRFTHLHRGVTPAGPAPHKLVLLLAVMREFAFGRIFENRIEPSNLLYDSYRLIWDKEIHTEHKPNFALPFFHLKGEGFWHLSALPGQEQLLNSHSCINSLGTLRRVIEFAYLDDALFGLFREIHSRRILCKTLLGLLHKQCEVVSCE